MNKILVIQTAFIGDVILATSLLENLHQQFPKSAIDIVLKRGNESLFKDHPFINKVFVFDKSSGKYKNLFSLLSQIRNEKYDVVIDIHRFGSSGFLTAFSGAKTTIGFDKNPFSFLFTQKIKHQIEKGIHEVDRNAQLISPLLKGEMSAGQMGLPKLYPSTADFEFVKSFNVQEFVCIAPTSVWFTKQFPAHKWIELINTFNPATNVYLLGATGDSKLCDTISTKSKHKNVVNLCGKLSLLQSAALMQSAKMNYVNDSAPMHLASAVNAPVTAVYCSTTPDFGFGPLSTNSKIIETKESLSCKPCGLHGFKECPQKHFKCAETIDIKDFN